jgi:hypothetical protein
VRGLVWYERHYAASEGDTLASMADDLGVPLEDLEKANEWR